MSYILEALKKAQAERQLGSAPTIHALPIQVAAAETAPPSPWPRRIVLGVAGLALAGVAGWWFALRQPAPALSVAQVPPATITAAPAPAPVAAVASETPAPQAPPVVHRRRPPTWSTARRACRKPRPPPPCRYRKPRRSPWHPRQRLQALRSPASRSPVRPPMLLRPRPKRCRRRPLPCRPSPPRLKKACPCNGNCPIKCKGSCHNLFLGVISTPGTPPTAWS